MTLSLTSLKTWATDNPLMAAGAGLLAVAGVVLAASKKARKAVGLGSTSHSTGTHRVHRRHKSKKLTRAKSVVLQ